MSDINIVLENRDDIHVAVEEKDINVEVPAGKDGRSLRPRGEWSASAAYAYLDLVSYQGSSYVALKAVPAGTLPTDTSYWMLSAEKGEPGTPEWGAITGDLSDQTDLQTALDAKADVIISSASGSIVSFSDGSPAPVTALSVAIDPVQDLHGYDNPWPAGGGKNICPDDGWSQGQINSSGGQGIESFSISSPYIYLSAGTYTLSRNYTDVGNGDLAYHTYNLEKVHQSDSGWTTNPKTFTLESDCYIRLTTRKNRNTDITPAIIDNGLYVQIESGSTATSWTPYSNICPISGHDTATMTRTGKNLFTAAGSSSPAYIGSNGVVVYGAGSASGWNVSDYIPVKGGITYHFTPNSTSGNSAKACCFDKDKNYISSYFNSGEITFTTPSNCAFMRFSYRDASTDIQLELGSSASSFEPYQPIQTVTIDLDGTRYGGVLDVLTGKMTVYRAMFNITSSMYWTTSTDVDENNNTYVYAYTGDLDNIVKPSLDFLCNRITPYYGKMVRTTPINGSAINISTNDATLLLRIKMLESIVGGTTTAILKSWLDNNPVQIVADILQPLTVQLTPAQMMQTLLGQNHIWADTGDVAVEYRADTKLYIDGKFSQLQALILEN